jgi:hypothetical protein
MISRRRNVTPLNPQPHYDIEEVRQYLQANIDELIYHLYGSDATLSGKEWRVAEANGGKGTSCVIARRGNKAGLWFDHNPGAPYKKGGIIDLIVIAKNLSFGEAIEWAIDWLNLNADLSGGYAATSAINLKRPLDIQTAGPENLARLESNLQRHPAALQYLYNRGLTLSTINKFHLGIKEPYKRKTDGKTVANALCYPIISGDGEALSRYGCYNIPGVTENPVDKNGWGRGSPTTYYSGSTAGKTILFVAEGCKDLWILDQHLASTSLDSEVVIVTSSHGSGIPDEWKTIAFWRTWTVVYFGHDNDKSGEQIAHNLIRFCGREAFRVRVPEDMGKDWTDFFNAGGTVEQFKSLLDNAPAVSGPAPERDSSPEQLGEFAAKPVNINGAFANGYLYYPWS